MLPDTLFNPSPTINSSSFTNIILTTNNFLSCRLPPTPEVHNLDKMFALVALGNSFESDVPSWVDATERDAQLLWVPKSAQEYIRDLLMAFVPAVILAIALALSSCGSKRPLPSLFIVPKTTTNRLLELFRSSVKACGALFVFGLVLMPIYGAGSKRYQCGNWLMHVTLTYLDDSPDLEIAVAVLLCVYTILCVACLTYIRAKDRRSAVRATLFAKKHHHNHGKQSRLFPRLRFMFSVVAVLVAWLLLLAVLVSPTLLFIALRSLPAINWGFLNQLDNFIPWAASFWLGVANVFIVPYACRRLCAHLPFPSECDGGGVDCGNNLTRSQQKWVLGLMVASRTLLGLWIPVALTIYLDDGCFQGWKGFWKICRVDSGKFDVTFDGIRVLSFSDVCAQQFLPGRCSRRVIDLMLHLTTRRMIFEIFLSPTYMYLYQRFQLPGRLIAFRCCCSWGPRSRSPPTLNRPRSKMFEFIPPTGCVARVLNFVTGWFYSSDKFNRKVNQIGLHQMISGIQLSWFAQLTTAWLDVVFVLGAVAPLLLLIIVIVITTHQYTIGYVSRGFTVVKPTVAPPLGYLMISIFMQTVLVSFFYYDNDLHGAYVVYVGCGLSGVLLVLSFTPAVFRWFLPRLVVSRRLNMKEPLLRRARKKDIIETVSRTDV
eukprot:c15188_g1_i4.p1 GENE.c15188_g1_i4~~c15188_g1_i4.p1  ORF type:complete len:655 (+),score=133.05 c15188_g1_i4:1-1965(+)